jgi:hypothetical protein
VSMFEALYQGTSLPLKVNVLICVIKFNLILSLSYVYLGEI